MQLNKKWFYIFFFFPLFFFFPNNNVFAYSVDLLENSAFTFTSPNTIDVFFSTSSISNLDTETFNDMYIYGAGATTTSYKSSQTNQTTATCSYGGWANDGYWIAGKITGGYYNEFNVWHCISGAIIPMSAFYGPTIGQATSTSFFSDQTASTTLINLQSQCSDSSNIFSEGICMATSFLFVPNNESINQFGTLKYSLEDKIPFVYGYEIGEIRNELLTQSASTTPTISIPFATFGTITLLSPSLLANIPFIGLIRQILGWLLWFMFAELIYYQFLKAHNKEHK